MNTRSSLWIGLRDMFRYNIDWLRFAVILMIALYASSYVMLSLFPY